MALPLKILLSFVGVVIATLAGAAIYITQVFDPNDYREQIASAVEENTGRKLAIDGPIELNLFPWVGARLNRITLANATGFGPEPMFEAQKIEARVELLPLFSREIRIGEVLLDGIRLRLATRSDGSDNWSDIGAADASQEAEPAEPEVAGADPTAAQGELPALRVEALRLTDIELIYLQDDERTRVAIDSLTTGVIELGQPSSLELRLKAELPQSLVAELKLQTGWLLELEGPGLSLPDLSLQTEVSGPGIPGGRQLVELQTALSYDGKAGTASIKDLSLDAAGLVASLNGDIDLSGAAPRGTIVLGTNAFLAHEVATRLGVPLAGGPDAGETQLNLELELGDDSLGSRRFDGRLAGAPFKGKLAIKKFSAPQILANLSIDSFVLEQWLPPETGAEEEAESESTPDTSDGPDPLETPIPLELVKDLHLDAEARIGRFSGKGIKAKDVTWVAKGRPGQPFSQQLSLNAYGGTLKASNTIDARGKEPKTGLVLNLDAMGLGDLLAGFGGQPLLTGLTNLNLNLNTAGNTPKGMLAALIGQASYRLQDGEMTGFSLVDLLDSGMAKLGGGNVSKKSSSGGTDFREVAGQLIFSGGKANSQSLHADSELMAIGGQGGVNLETLSWDLTLLPKLKDHPKVRSSKELSRLIGLAVPVTLSGPLTSPKIGVDLEGALEARAQQKLDEEKQRLRDKAEKKLKDKLGDDLGKKLGDLFR